MGVPIWLIPFLEILYTNTGCWTVHNKTLGVSLTLRVFELPIMICRSLEHHSK